MSITAADVKALREKTGAGMMKCKEALNECSGNFDDAVDYLRKKGLAAAAKKQSRVAAEGTIVSLVDGGKGLILEVNCETDFVSKGDDFKNFAKGVAEYALSNGITTLEALREAKNVDAHELTLKCGEKVDIRRFEAVTSTGTVGQYNHGGKIGVLVEATASDAGNAAVQGLLKDLAMHVAAAAPTFLNADQIDADFKAKEAEIYAGQLKEEGKPEKMIPKIVEGKLRKLASDICLLEQKFVKNPDLTVAKHIAAVTKEAGVEFTVNSFMKLTLGEGVEKREDNLADEVAKMTGKQ